MGEYFSEVNIFQGWLFFGGEYLSFAKLTWSSFFPAPIFQLRALCQNRQMLFLCRDFPTTNKWQMAICTAPVWKLSFYFSISESPSTKTSHLEVFSICPDPSHWLMESFDRRNYRWPSVRARWGQREETIQDKFWSNSTALIPSK